MSKKNTNNTNEMNTGAHVTLKDMMEKYPNVSLRAVSKIAGITYQTVLSNARKPIPNVPYDPTVINYEELEKLLLRKEAWSTVMNCDWEVLNSITKGHAATLCKDIEQFEVGMKVYLRENNELPYEIIYKTETHIVIMLEGTSEPRAMSVSTFFLKGPSFEKRVVEK